MVNKRNQGFSYDSSFKIGSSLISFKIGWRLISKKAQMKIQQTAFMLLAITMFFVLVGIFVLVFRFSSLKESATILEEKNAMLLVEKLANSPEFACGNAFGSSRISCIDEDKVLALKNNIDKYEGFWGVSSIEIIKIYPELETIQIYSEGNTGYTFSNFVALCKKASLDGKIYDKCELAKILVGYESKQ